MEDKKVIELCSRFSMERIHKVCTPMITRYGGLYDYDYDDFFSIANDTVFDCARHYDESKGNFDLFVLGCIKKKFKTEMTRRNRKKRIRSKDVDRLDELDEDGNPVGNKIASNFCVEDNIEELSEEEKSSKRVEKFMSGISKKNKAVAILIMQGFKTQEILDELQITTKEYNDALTEFKAYRNVRVLLD